MDDRERRAQQAEGADRGIGEDPGVLRPVAALDGERGVVVRTITLYRCVEADPGPGVMSRLPPGAS